jgi:hypothetical protein
LNAVKEAEHAYQLHQEGGLGYFPGLNKPVAIEVDRLRVSEAEELKRLMEAAHFFDLPATIGSPARGAADYQYVEDVTLQALMHAVQKQVKAARAVGREASHKPATDTAP